MNIEPNGRFMVKIKTHNCLKDLNRIIIFVS